jgi:hypothetical protein
MWGAARHDRSEGVHRALTATAAYFGSLTPGAAGTAQQVLVAVDHCLFGIDEVNRILEHAAAESGLPREAITISFSHTHAAGLLNLDRREMPGGELIPDYLDTVMRTIGRLVATSVENAMIADIVYGTGRCNLAAHRDLLDTTKNEYVCGFNPGEEADDALVVARVTDSEGRLIGTFVNYACHPTTLAWDNRLISPDFPGALRQVVEEATEAPCVYLQGASGDLGPVEGFVGDTAVADRNGRQLGYAALSVFESLPPANTTFQYAGPVVSGALIGTWKRVPIDEDRAAQLPAWSVDRESVQLEYRDDLPQRDQVETEREQLLVAQQSAIDRGDTQQAADLRALVERQTRMLGRLKGLPPGDGFPCRATMWRVGDAIWIAVQGEPYNILQKQLRARFPNTPIVVSTIADGWGPSYLPPREVYGTGIYQETIAALAPGCLEQLIENLIERSGDLLKNS